MGLNHTQAPTLLILNQMAGPMTWELAEDLGKALGPVALLTGHPDTLAKGEQETVYLYPATPYERGGYLRRVLSWLRYLWQAFFWLWRWPRQTPLLLFSNPPLLPWLGYLAWRLHSQRYAVMVHDIYPDVLVRMGKLPENHMLTRTWRWLNRRAYEHAGVVMTLGETMAANLEKQFDPRRTRAGKVEVVYPWVDTDRIRPIPKEANWFAQKYAQVGKLTVMYSGNMGFGHDIETMLAAARELGDMPKVQFMFIGAGPKWKLVEEAIVQENLTNVTLLPWQPEEALPFSLATADIALVSLEKQINGLAVPSKAIYALAAGASIIALAFQGGELHSLLQAYQCGVLIEPGNSAALVSAIRMLASGQGELRSYSEHARQVAVSVFSQRANSRQIIELVT